MVNRKSWLKRMLEKMSRPQCKLTPRTRLEIENLESRVVPAGVVASYAVTQDWGSGFQAQVQLKNQQTSAVSNWRLEFDYAASISSIWDARIVSHVGDHYVIESAGWNSTLAANGAVSFGFVASPGKSPPAPSNYVLNGAALGGTTPPPVLVALSIADAEVTDGNSGSKNLAFSVTLSGPATSAVTVSFSTASGTAMAGSDFTALSGSLTFNPGETQKTINVQVLGDTLFEADETFAVNLVNPVGASLSRAQAIGTIRNDDAAPSTGSVQFRVLDSWNSGFTGEITLRNTGTTALNGWTLAFDFAGTISSIWNASIVSHVGTRYVVKNASWNGTLAANATATFGFVASPGSPTAPPSNFAINGASGGGGTTTNRPPTAVNDSAVAYLGQATRISVLANDSDPDQNPLSVTAVTQGQHGAVVGNSDGTITYTPRAGFTGSDTFTYTIADGKGGTATATVTVTVLDPAASTWPAQYYAPYVDMALWPMYDLSAAARDQGIKYFTLAFIVADAGNQPAWGGYQEYRVNGGGDWDTAIKNHIAGVRAVGGDVMISFGGANGRELAEAITDVNALKTAYQKVIDTYQATQLDFDIEGAAQADRVSVDRRSQALAALQRDAAAAGRPLSIWLTLPVLPTGLTADGLYVVQSALHHGVSLAGVNIMAMDYGDSAAPNPQGKMGDYAIQAATSTFNQLKGLYNAAKSDAQLWQMIGVTPMIGLNDVTTEVFDQQEARELVAFAEQMGLGRISMWSLNRDKQNPSGTLNHVDLMSSSILQQPFEFSRIFGEL
ncbi:MAG: hypothetical protein FJ271_14475 [Planctomycetes bacterium]|nr:hypothetical protein [Planctomycetota bacterium]